MRVDGLADVDRVGAHFDGERKFADEVSGASADDTAADDAVRCVVEVQTAMAEGWKPETACT